MGLIVLLEVFTENIGELDSIKEQGHKWFVYDVWIEGVSLVNNYRVQISSILERSSFKDLLEQLRAKVAET